MDLQNDKGSVRICPCTRIGKPNGFHFAVAPSPVENIYTEHFPFPNCQRTSRLVFIFGENKISA